MPVRVELDYDRQAYACRHYGICFATLEDYIEHLVKNCDYNTVGDSKGHQNFQIRALVQEPAFKPKVLELCMQKWGSAAAIEQLWWDCSTDCLAQIVERLEYGVTSSVGTAGNLGIVVDQLESMLESLIEESALREKKPLMLPPSTQRQSRSHPCSKQNKVAKLVGWLRPGLRSWPKDAAPDLLANELLGDDGIQPKTSSVPNINDSRAISTSLLAAIPARPKRPISGSSTEHPESTLRAGYKPFAYENVGCSNNGTVAGDVRSDLAVGKESDKLSEISTNWSGFSEVPETFFFEATTGTEMDDALGDFIFTDPYTS